MAVRPYLRWTLRRLRRVLKTAMAPQRPPLTLYDYYKLLCRHGTDLRRWPDEDREDAVVLLRGSALARRRLRDMRALERLILLSDGGTEPWSDIEWLSGRHPADPAKRAPAKRKDAPPGAPLHETRGQRIWHLPGWKSGAF